MNDELRDKTLAIIDRQIEAICKEVISDGCVSHNNSSLVAAISTLRDLIYFRDGDDDSGEDGDGSSG